MKCVDIHSQDEYDARKNDKDACLHIVAGTIAEVGSASVGRVTGSARVGRVTGSARVGRVDGSASVGRVVGSARVGWVTGSARVGRVDGSARVGCVDGSASVGWVTGSASVGRVTGSARVGRVTGSARVGWVDGSASVGCVDGSASVGWVDGSARVGRVDGSARVEAAGTATVHAYAGTVHATQSATVYQHADAAQITGGHVSKVPDVASMDPVEWAGYSGVRVDGDNLIVFKAVDKDLVSGRGTTYPVGGVVVAADWSTVAECGNGLHFGPRPAAAGGYLDSHPKRYLACSVRIVESVVIDSTKIKARACTVLYEVMPEPDITEAVSAGA